MQKLNGKMCFKGAMITAVLFYAGANLQLRFYLGKKKYWKTFTALPVL